MNEHLNVFVPYQRDAWHEDHLTRAAMVVMRLVPPANAAFLRWAADVDVERLPPGEIDMQTSRVQREPGALEELVSIFLTPDEAAPGLADSVVDDQRAQRLDGVIRHEPKLVVVIESKVREGASDWQARHLNLAGVEPRRHNKRELRWRDVIEDWWALIESDVLDETGRRLIRDFFDFASRYFSAVMPYSTLRRAGEDEVLVVRRLRAVLTEATGLAAESGARHVMLPGTQCVQRAQLERRDGKLRLACWPAEMVKEAEHLYGSDERVSRLIALSQRRGWEVIPNPHLSFFRAPRQRRCYLTCTLDPAAYLRSWRGKDRRFGRYPREEVEGSEFWDWLLEEGYADPTDRADFDRLLAEPQPRFDLRASVEVVRVWTWNEALELDDREGALAGAVRNALDELLAVLDEPTVAEMRATA